MSASFGAIYYRNAVNSGFPVLKGSDFEDLVIKKALETGDVVEVDFEKGEGRNISKNRTFRLEPMNPVQYDIYQAGGLFEYAKMIRNQ